MGHRGMRGMDVEARRSEWFVGAVQCCSGWNIAKAGGVKSGSVRGPRSLFFVQSELTVAVTIYQGQVSRR